MTQRKLSKLFVAPLLVIILVMSMIGCGKTPEPDNDTDDEEKYELILDCGFEADETFYAEGEKVKVYYNIIATDTDYRFYTDSDDVDLSIDYSDKKGYIIKFKMPDHDVELHVDSHNTMDPIEPDPVIEEKVREINYNSPESVLDFTVGTWTLVDDKTGTAYGELNVYEDGTCDFYKMADRKTLTGTLSFMARPGAFISGITGYELTFSGLKDAYDCWTDTDTSGGLFRLCQSAGTDYMYLEEIGNGGSNVAYYLLSDEEDFYNDMNWMFIRDNDITIKESPFTSNDFDSFTAMVVESGDGGLLLQRLAGAESESVSEYTGFRFMAAQFYVFPDEQAVWYDYSSHPDLSLVLNEAALNEKYPSTIYEVMTDSSGDIISMSELDHAAYGDYEEYPLSQSVSVDGTSFEINDYVFDIETYGCIGDLITDYEQMGDYLILESHVNPHRSEYLIFDMRVAWPVTTLYGCNFIHGNNIWDSFYSDMNAVYDYEGHLIHTVDDCTEICGLSFEGENIKIEYWKDDYETVYEEEIEKPECLNSPIYYFAEYKHHQTALTWSYFRKYGTSDDLFMVMVNPPEDEAWLYNMPQELEKDGSDIIYVIALQDETRIEFSNGDYEFLDKGQVAAYSLTIPEGAPRLTLFAETPDGRTSEWEIGVISGESDIRWIFR
ncbi:MAG: hypothetical protein IKN97_02155 [Lachnospiraceae bacterium]|nr:hypothetical protein [Lachnospiraceae bacterium]